MGWGIYVKEYDLYIPRIRKNEIRDRIEDLEHFISREKEDIISYVSATPANLEDLDQMIRVVRDILDEYEEDIITLDRLLAAKENIDNVVEY